jgi:hypothetical protein
MEMNKFMDIAANVLAYSNLLVAAWVTWFLWHQVPGFAIWTASMGLCYLINHWTISGYERGFK